MYLNTLKHLDFQLVEEISQKEVEDNKKSQKTTIEQLKKNRTGISIYFIKKINIDYNEFIKPIYLQNLCLMK